MTTLPNTPNTARHRASTRPSFAAPVVATLAIGAAALAALAFFTIALVVAGMAAAGFALWRVSARLPGAGHPTATTTTDPDRRRLDAFRAEMARRAHDAETTR